MSPHDDDMTHNKDPKDRQKCGYVALVGLPNVGKSTLVNQFVGAKVSIVSHKVQTTRRRILGIQVQEESQLIFVDTPGIFSPRKGLDRAMVSSAWSAVGEADVVLVLVDVRKPDQQAQKALLDRILKMKKPTYLVLNKIDQVDKKTLLALAQDLTQGRALDKTFMISALKGQGVNDLLTDLARVMPEEPWRFPEDQLTDLPLRLMAAERTREKVFEFLHQELPYAIAVETETWEEFENGAVKIGQVIHVQKPAQKAIVLGKKGSAIKRISALARQDISAFLERPVHLFLHVRVTEKWSQDRENYEALGLEGFSNGSGKL